MPWSFDPVTRTYQETDSGQTLSETQLRPIARSFLNAALTRTREVTGELANNRLCLVGEQLVTSHDAIQGFRRWHDGDVITLVTKGASRLVLTPNHPVLSSRGWVRADQLQIGDDLVREGFDEREALSSPHVQHGPTPIAQLVGALSKTSVTEGAPAEIVYFDGQWSEPQVDVVAPYGLLRNRHQSARLKPALQLPLVGRHALRQEPSLAAGHARQLRLGSSSSAATLSAAQPQLGRARQHTTAIRFGLAAQRDAALGQPGANSVVIDAEAMPELLACLASAVARSNFGPREVSRETTGASAARKPGFTQAVAERGDVAAELERHLRERLAAGVATDNLISIDRQAFHGWVYDLGTIRGYFAADGITVHNSVPEWEVEMRRIVKETFGASYALSRGGRESMSPSDWGRLGQLARRQYQFLNDYARDIESAGLTRDRALSRSDLYIASARQAYQRGKLATFSDMPRLPRVPGDGTTKCISNCRCELDVTPTDEGYEVYWLDLGDDRECVDCLSLAREWAPLRVGRSAARATQSSPQEEPPA